MTTAQAGIALDMTSINAAHEEEVEFWDYCKQFYRECGYLCRDSLRSCKDVDVSQETVWTVSIKCRCILVIPVIILLLIIIVMVGQSGDACCGLFNDYLTSDDIDSFDISIQYVGDLALCAWDDTIADSFIINDDSMVFQNDSFTINITNITNITLSECIFDIGYNISDICSVDSLDSEYQLDDFIFVIIFFLIMMLAKVYISPWCTSGPLALESKDAQIRWATVEVVVDTFCFSLAIIFIIVVMTTAEYSSTSIEILDEVEGELEDSCGTSDIIWRTSFASLSQYIWAVICIQLIIIILEYTILCFEIMEAKDIESYQVMPYLCESFADKFCNEGMEKLGQMTYELTNLVS